MLREHCKEDRGKIEYIDETYDIMIPPDRPWRLGEPVYPLSKEDEERIEKDFVYRPSVGSQAERYVLIGAIIQRLARSLMENCPKSRELSLAITHLEECMLWAEKSISKNEPNLY